MLQPEDVIPHLGKPGHWRQGRSAKALADSWFAAGDVPDSVRLVLRRSPELHDAELIEAWLERETDLGDGRGARSQSDLLALIGLGDELAVLGIEAKVDESFGPRVADWLAAGGAGRVDRLARLCALLGLAGTDVDAFRYQLFHRTAALLLEARRFRARRAVLVVQSFCPEASGLEDARAFFAAIGLGGLVSGAVVGPIVIAGVSLWVGWAADQLPCRVAMSEREEEEAA